MTAARQLGASNEQIAMASNATAGSVATLLAPASAAGPIGLAVAGVALALMAIFSRKGPGQRIASTKIVDELEPQLRANVAGYLSGPRTSASQAQALANFDAAWAFLASSSACGNQDLGDPGKACINDRARGGKWDWFAYYRDPIANDQEVKTDAVSNAASSLFPDASAGFIAALEEWAIPVGILAAVVLL